MMNSTLRTLKVNLPDHTYLLIVGRNFNNETELQETLRRFAFSPQWHPKTDPTPKGVKLWASDGKRVWEIWGSGEPIGEYATKVHYWAVKHMPDPPAPGVDNGRNDSEVGGHFNLKQIMYDMVVLAGGSGWIPDSIQNQADAGAAKICRGGEMADAAGLNPAGRKYPCGFDSRPRY